ncbi:MAG: PQQ-dependent sugar dehydrogenase [Solirubrobacterales bacterium]
MRGRFCIAAAAAALAFGAGCGGSDEDGPVTDRETTTTTTADADAADEGARPRVGDGQSGVRLQEIGEFEEPVHVTQPPGGDPGHLYVVERCGEIQRVPVGGGEPETFLDLSEQVECGGTEQGLLSVAFAPDYRDSGLFYVYYTDTGQNQTVAEYEASADGSEADPGSARELLTMEDFASNHNGGLLLFGPDDRLWIGTGDGGGADDPERNGQDLTQLLGKILRIDPTAAGGEPYSIPRDNPYLDEPEARPEIAINGMRNPWRFAFDRETDDLWIADVGQNELEEIDSVSFEEVVGREAAVNFGWSAFEGSQRFNEDQEAPGALPPVHEYGRELGCSVTGGLVVRNPELTSLYGRYVYGDFCEGELRSFTARAGEPATDDRELGVEVASLSSFGEDTDANVYATSLEGPVYRLAAGG